MGRSMKKNLIGVSVPAGKSHSDSGAEFGAVKLELFLMEGPPESMQVASPWVWYALAEFNTGSC